MTTPDERTSIIERALQGSSAGEDAASQLELLFSEDPSLIMKTEIPPGLIVPIARGYTIAYKTKSDVLKYFLDMILKAQISKDRQGRLELMEAITAFRRQSMEEDL